MPWIGAAVLIVAGSLWYGLSHADGPSISATVADCSNLLQDSVSPPPVTTLRPGVVGLGSVASLATFATTSGVHWCFDGMGVGAAPITQRELHSALDVPVAVVDGTLKSDVLMLVHLGKHTRSVVVTTSQSRSYVLAHGGGFEVLRIPMAAWPDWHAPWPHGPVTLGRVTGFDGEGRVTSSLPFSWCPGSIDTSPDSGC